MIFFFHFKFLKEVVSRIQLFDIQAQFVLMEKMIVSILSNFCYSYFYNLRLA